MNINVTLTDQLQEKQRELTEDLLPIIYNSTDKHSIANSLIGLLCTIDAPILITEIEPIDTNMHLYKFESGGRTGRGGGTSRKAGNIVLNIKKVMEGLGEGVFTIFGGNAIPYLMHLPPPFNISLGYPLAALLVARKLSSLVNIQIDEKHAAVFAALWDIKEPNSRLVTGEDKYQRVNSTIISYGITPLSKDDYDFIISKLSDIKSIFLQADGNILLTEEIKSKY